MSEPAAAKDRLRDLRQQAEEWLREARESVWDLRSPVRWETTWRPVCVIPGNRSPGERAQFHLTVSGAATRRRRDLQEHLLRITQEAARNAIQHGGAKEIEMHVEYVNEDWIRVLIHDNGCGFDLEEASLKSGHWGLETMRERAAKMGAVLTIKTAPGEGVEIEIVSSIHAVKR